MLSIELQMDKLPQYDFLFEGRECKISHLKGNGELILIRVSPLGI